MNSMPLNSFLMQYKLQFNIANGDIRVVILHWTSHAILVQEGWIVIVIYHGTFD